MKYEFFDWLFSLKSDQVLFVILTIVISVAIKKMLKLLEEKSSKIDKKDEKILELIDKVNSTQTEITKALEKIRTKSDFDQASIIAEFKLLETNLKHLEGKVDSTFKLVRNLNTK